MVHNFADTLAKNSKVIARENFNTYIEAGNQLALPQLKKLNSTWKRDYANHVVKSSDDTSCQIKNRLEAVQVDQEEFI